ncbi:MAG: hypothetical protein PHD72_00340 [Patescibacteria group bacterium]|nr:hypothetical protein [Patescibacteria group bacterium]
MPETNRDVDPEILARVLRDQAVRKIRVKPPAHWIGQEPNFGPETRKPPEFYGDHLAEMMRQIAEQINKDVLAEYGLADFLNSDNSLNMNGYADGPHTAEKVRADEASVFASDLNFSGARSKDTQEEYGVNTPEAVVPLYRERKKLQKNYQMEMAVTALLHKILGGDYLVVRASALDDYNNGVDNIIINKQTGEVICAFDEVHESGTGERTEKKNQKIKTLAVRGGAKVRYGIKMEKGKLQRASMSNVPVFYLGLSSKELENLLDNMNFDLDGEIQPKEYETFAQLVASLKEQLAVLNGMKNVHFAVFNKLKTFGALLDDFEAKGKNPA